MKQQSQVRILMGDVGGIPNSCWGPGEVAQWVKLLSHKPGDPSFIPGTYVKVEKRTDPTKLSSALHIHVRSTYTSIL